MKKITTDFCLYHTRLTPLMYHPQQWTSVTRSWGISNEVILVWIQIDRRFRYEPTKTGYESTECGYETTAGTKKLDTVKKKLVKLRFLCNRIFLESSNQVCCLCESGYFDKLRRPGEGVISKKAYYYWNFF